MNSRLLRLGREADFWSLRPYLASMYTASTIVLIVNHEGYLLAATEVGRYTGELQSNIL